MTKLSRREFLSILGIAPAAVLIPQPRGLSFSLGIAEIQLEDTEPFVPDYLYAAGLKFGFEQDEPDDRTLFRKTSNSYAELHYVRDKKELIQFYHYGLWVEGDSGLPRFVVLELL